jgi:hypothetical protein
MDEKQWYDFPESRVREIRMNFSMKTWNLKKAPVDMTFTDSFLVHIGGGEEELLSRMKPKTRYNIRLAQRKGVQVCIAPVEKLPIFYRLYRETALRNRFSISEFRYFSALFSASGKEQSDSDVLLMLATHDGDVLAGAVMAISKTRALFLHGASSHEKRSCMASYASHWEAIRYARRRHCLTYDMGAVSPSKDPGHSFYGLYSFQVRFWRRGSSSQRVMGLSRGSGSLPDFQEPGDAARRQKILTPRMGSLLSLIPAAREDSCAARKRPHLCLIIRWSLSADWSPSEVRVQLCKGHRRTPVLAFR